MKASVGIITFHHANNYGAVLQAYALSRYIQSCGYEPKIIDYRPIYLHDTYRKVNWKALGLTHPVKWRACRNFDTFRDEHLRLTSQFFKTCDEMKKNLPIFDSYVCGSDQIWNPNLTFDELDPAFFLEFAPKSSRRISYAASFGMEKLPTKYLETFKNLSGNLDYISVREKSGASIIKKVLGIQPQHVVDPTLLMADLKSFGSRRSIKIGSPYILFFRLKKESNIYNVVSALREKIDTRILTITQNAKFWQEPGEKYLNPDPSTWIELFKNASGIITNSFHATIFALLFKKPFISVKLTGENTGKNSRISELLAKVGLSNRFVDNHTNQSVDEIFLEKIDWDYVFSSLESLRKDSEEFLKNSLP
ncbi:MAG: polysaccharide pyruvyl transferase family protein [Methanosarcina mazei]|nr:polysaccharide pyruvyl transferase family protein [Methanosarcina mazei]